MLLEENQKLFLSDTLVPDIFILEYLPTLGGLAVKIYIYLLMAVRRRKNVTETDLVRRLDTDMDAVKAAFVELEAVGLVSRMDKGYAITDVKAAEIDRTYRLRTESSPSESDADARRDPARAKLMNDISKTFYQGLMSPSWYGVIDSWFDRYGFEPEVLYSLFQVCKQGNKLGNKAYITSVAEDWGRRGITTFTALNAHFASRERVRTASRTVGRKLRKNMSEYDEEYIAKWTEKYGYSMEIIDIALRRAVKIANPNLAYFDQIITEWFSNGLKTPEAVEKFERDKLAKTAAARAGLRTGGGAAPGTRPSNVGNFTQREYSDEFIEALYEDVTTLTDDGTKGVADGPDR
ncbi:MAG: DnaD domain protein [Clostridia bacterium]|nr:DnaD domain protein [Clostridia bacterium]